MKRTTNDDEAIRGNGLLKLVALAGLSVVMLGATFGFLGSAASAIPDDGNRGQEGNVGAPSDPPNHSDDDNQDERDRAAAKKKAQPPSKPNPNPPSDNVVADLLPPRTTPSGATHDPNLNVYYGDTQKLIGVATGGKPAANNPVNPIIVKSAVSKCDFKSETHNLAATRAMFPARCGGPWHPELHKCDYNSDGWRCYSL